MNTAHEELRHAVERIAGREVTKAEVERVAAMPGAAYLIVSGAQGVDAFLRGLSDELFLLLRYLADEHLNLVDLNEPQTWDPEFLFLTARLCCDETGADDLTDDALIKASMALAHLINIESWRRNGAYEWVAPYSLRSSRLPATIRTKWSERSGTEH